MAAVPKHAVLGAFRRLLRTKDAVFKNDPTVQAAATVEIKKRFRDNADVAPEELPQCLADVDEAIEFLTQNVVQATLQEETGTYRATIEEHHELGVDLYEEVEKSKQQGGGCGCAGAAQA